MVEKDTVVYLLQFLGLVKISIRCQRITFIVSFANYHLWFDPNPTCEWGREQKIATKQLELRKTAVLIISTHYIPPIKYGGHPILRERFSSHQKINSKLNYYLIILDTYTTGSK